MFLKFCQRNNMKYPVKIEQQIANSEWQLTVPDLPGCTTSGNSIDDVLIRAKDAIADHLAILSEYGESIPHASAIDSFINGQPQVNVVWAVVDFDIVPYLGKSHKINVTLPELLIKKIDDRVSKSEKYKTRSGFIANACIVELNK